MMKQQPKTPKYSPETRERAVRMVFEHRGEYASPRAAIESIAPKIGCSPHTLNEWVKRHEIDTGRRDGVTTLFYNPAGACSLGTLLFTPDADRTGTRAS